jgi:hypothetical protein
MYAEFRSSLNISRQINFNCSPVFLSEDIQELKNFIINKSETCGVTIINITYKGGKLYGYVTVISRIIANNLLFNKWDHPKFGEISFKRTHINELFHPYEISVESVGPECATEVRRCLKRLGKLKYCELVESSNRAIFKVLYKIANLMEKFELYDCCKFNSGPIIHT